jgi:hypothetical protein
MPEISSIRTLSFPYPETVVSLSGPEGGNSDTDIKLQPEARNTSKKDNIALCANLFRGKVLLSVFVFFRMERGRKRCVAVLK